MSTRIKLSVFLLLGVISVGCITINNPPQNANLSAPPPVTSGERPTTVSPPWEMGKANTALYYFITDEELGGGESKRGYQNNFKGAVARGLSLADVLSQHERLYGAPVAFIGTVGAMHRIDFDEGRATMAGLAVTSDGTSIDGVVTVVTPYTPHLTNGDVGLVIGYVGDKPLQLGETTTAFVVARGILTPEEAIRYGLKKK